jgi:hypothetical protein
VFLTLTGRSLRDAEAATEGASDQHTPRVDEQSGAVQ